MTFNFHLLNIISLEIFEHYWNCLCHHVAISCHLKLPSQGYFPRSPVFQRNQEQLFGFPEKMEPKYFQNMPLFQQTKNKLQICSNEIPFQKYFQTVLLFRNTIAQVCSSYSKKLQIFSNYAFSEKLCCK